MASEKRDPFEVLGLPPGASLGAIRARYKELVQRYHPDKHGRNPLAELAEEKLRDINWAYRALTSEASETAGAASARPEHSAPKVDLETAIQRTNRLRQLLLLLVSGLAVLRFGGLLVRELALLGGGLLRVGGAALAELRSPITLVLALVAAVWAGAAWLRRRRRNGDRRP